MMSVMRAADIEVRRTDYTGLRVNHREISAFQWLDRIHRWQEHRRGPHRL